MSGSAAGPIVLSASTAIGNVAAISSTGGFDLNTAGALTITGPTSDTAEVTLQSGGALLLNGAVTTGTLSLISGTIDAPGGMLMATTLSDSDRSATLTGSNRIAGLDTFSVSGAVARTDTTDFSITGSGNVGAFTRSAPGHTVTQASGTITVVSLSATAGTLLFPGLSTPTATVTTTGASWLGQLLARAHRVRHGRWNRGVAR